MYSDFVLLDRFPLSYRAKKHTHTHRDSNEYPIVAFSKNATIKRVKILDVASLYFLSTNYKKERRVIISTEEFGSKSVSVF